MTMTFPAPAALRPHTELLETVRKTAAGQARKPIALFDMDGNMFDWTTRFHDLLLSIDPAHPIVPESERDGFDYFWTKDANRDTILDALNHPELYANLDLIDGAEEAFHAPVDAGFDVFLCSTPTWSNPGCVEGKLESIASHLGPQWLERTIFTHDKTLVTADVLFDDKPVITGARTPDWIHALFTQPYNRSVFNRDRVTAWSDWTRALRND